MKIAHLHIANTGPYEDKIENKKTLVAQVKNGYIDYTLWGGWTSDGTRFSLANLGCRKSREWNPPLPVTTTHKTKEEFVAYLINVIHDETFYTVIDEVKPVAFAG